MYAGSIGEPPHGLLAFGARRFSFTAGWRRDCVVVDKIIPIMIGIRRFDSPTKNREAAHPAPTLALREYQKKVRNQT